LRHQFLSQGCHGDYRASCN